MASEIVKCRTMPREVDAFLWDGKSRDLLKRWGCYVSHGSIWIGELGKFWPEPPEKFALWFVPLAAVASGKGGE